LDVTEKALEVARSQIELAATRAKELASRQLLQELAEEEAARKVTFSKTPSTDDWKQQ
jgi:hypothetical protein